MDGSKPTVHMMDWPNSDLTKVDERLEKAMSMVQEIVDTVTRERQLKNVKLRWPMKRMVIKVDSNDTLALVEGAGGHTAVPGQRQGGRVRRHRARNGRRPF